MTLKMALKAIRYQVSGERKLVLLRAGLTQWTGWKWGPKGSHTLGTGDKPVPRAFFHTGRWWAVGSLGQMVMLRAALALKVYLVCSYVIFAEMSYQ